MGGAGGATGEIYQGLFDPNNPLLGNILAAAQKYNVGATQGMEQYYQTQGEYGNLYGNEVETIKRNLEHRYGGTYDELSGKFFSGSDKDRNAFMQMVQGIQGLSSMFPGLDPGYMFGSDKILESLKPLVTGDVVQAYAGKSKVNGTDPMSLLNNYIVDLSSQGKAGIFEADKTSVSDISSKIGAGSATKDEIKSMQDTLQRYGYDLGKSGVDGNLGPKTKAALKQFQDDVSSGKLTLDTLPDSVTKATTSIDGLTTAANAFVSWINRNIIGNPGTTGPTGTTGTTTGVTGQDAGSGAGPGSGVGEGKGVIGTISSAGDVMSSAASDFAAKAASAAASSGSLSTNASNAASNVNIFAQKLANLKFPTGGGGGPGMHEVPKASGGITNGPEHTLIGEDGPEAIIPLSEKRRSRGLSLWKAAGAAMGVKIFADGGIVGDAGQAAPASNGAVAQIRSITIPIKVHGGGDADSVVAALREKMPEVANAVVDHIAKAMEKSYSNMPVSEGA